MPGGSSHAKPSLRQSGKLPSPPPSCGVQQGGGDTHTPPAVTRMRRSHSSRTSGAPTTQRSLTLAVQDPFWPSALSALRAAVQEQASCLQDKDAEALAAEALKACKNDPKAALAILVAISKIQRALDGARARKDAEAASAATEGTKVIDTDLLGTLRYAVCIRLLLCCRLLRVRHRQNTHGIAPFGCAGRLSTQMACHPTSHGEACFGPGAFAHASASAARGMCAHHLQAGDNLSPR